MPQLAEGIMAAAEPCVLWLDELHRYLDHGCGLIASGLRKVLRSGTTVLATLDGAAYEYWRRSDVVRQMRSLVLDRCWSVAERQRARMSQDPRVAQAAQADSAIGVAECLAAGPWLWQELRLADRVGGQPRGAALTWAGIDLIRVGLGGPLPTELLLDAHVPYLADSGGPLVRPESAEDALAWAGKTRFGVSSMLLPAGDGVWKVHPQLVATVQEAGIPVHPFTWFQAVGAADDIDDMFTVALNASQHAPSLGVFLWQCLADAGILRAANNLGVTLADLGRHEEAEQVYRAQADLQDPYVLLNLGNLLWKTGRYDEAAGAYRESGTRGHATGWNNLGLLFREQGQLAHAETCLRSAALAGAADAEFNLGVLLADLGRPEEAIAAYARAEAAGDLAGLVNWGMLLAEEGRWTEAEPLFRRGAESGDKEAVFCLANALKAQGSLQEAANWYHRAIGAGDDRAQYNLANLHRDDGRPDLAEPLYRSAAEAGITSALYNLALLLEGQKRFPEAEALLRQAVEDGCSQALFHLGELLRRTDRPDEAAAQWRLAAEAGDATAAIALATVLTSPSDRPYLRRVLLRAADTGDHDAAHLLSVLNSSC
ncbi:tetratricopeptide repeat protein [Streptomyces rhizosphaericus]|uniref:Tetratricopeptide/SEL1-like repeat protein n=1 Tax=Streptomyces rhizosphaericus TaxID=114699 RepID=A0A6G4AE99_9ACTN|nr:tetratricopeptide repeat protein [Streptomyces rhizosphaericus]NEW71019.1 tetratricopeptide/SEL1-like repeat protein [Streptomyces rhizosphaericus]